MLPQHVVFGARLAVVEHDQHVAGIHPITFLAALLLSYLTFSRSGTPECRTLSASDGLARRRRRRRIGRDCCATATGELRSAFVAKISKRYWPITSKIGRARMIRGAGWSMLRDARGRRAIGRTAQIAALAVSAATALWVASLAAEPAANGRLVAPEQAPAPWTRP